MKDYPIEISVVVPVYNVQKYLSYCLDSILSQEGVVFEVICVEDCSTDASKEILREYALKNQKIRTIFHDKNKGLSASRNDGIYAAKGKYIWFVDSDDSIVKDALRKLYYIAESNHVDMVSFGMECVYESKELEQRYRTTKFRYNYEYDLVCSGQKMLADLLSNNEFAYGCVPRYLINKDFLFADNLFFKDDLVFEDNLYVPLCFLKAKRVKCINESYYHRLRRCNSITTSETEKVKAESLFVCYKELCDAANAMELDDNGKFALSEILSELSIIIRNIVEKEHISFNGTDLLDRHLWNLICGKMSRKAIEIRVKQVAEMSRGKGIYIYGAGKYADEVFRELNGLNIIVDGVIVTKKEEDKKSIWGHSIIEFKEIKSSLKDAIVLVAIAGEIGSQIKAMLVEYGITGVVTIE